MLKCRIQNQSFSIQLVQINKHKRVTAEEQNRCFKMQNEISNKPWGLVRPLNKSDVHLALGYMFLGEERTFYEF